MVPQGQPCPNPIRLGVAEFLQDKKNEKFQVVDGGNDNTTKHRSRLERQETDWNLYNKHR